MFIVSLQWTYMGQLSIIQLSCKTRHRACWCTLLRGAAFYSVYTFKCYEIFQYATTDAAEQALPVYPVTQITRQPTVCYWHFNLCQLQVSGTFLNHSSADMCPSVLAWHGCPLYGCLALPLETHYNTYSLKASLTTWNMRKGHMSDGRCYFVWHFSQINRKSRYEE